jgi:uncharacterized protein involved in outer membrane biogenesis
VKKVLIGLVAVGVLLIAAILIAPSFIDWNAYKQQISALVQEATGRQLTIRGNIDVTILPRPALRVEDVRLASIPGAVSPEMIRLPEARISVAFAPLLEGQLAAVVTLIRPVVNLEKLRDGSGNWDFAKAQAGLSGGVDGSMRPGSAGSDLPLDFKLDSFRIVDGAIGYHDAATGTLERIEKLNSEISFDSLDGPFRVDGTANVRGVPIALKISTGVVREESPLSTIVEVAIPETESTLRLNGTLSHLENGPAVTGGLEVNAKSAAPLLALLSGAEIPGRLAQPLTMQGSVSADKDAIMLEALDIELGAARATGDVKAELGDKTVVTVAMRTGNLNLDAFLDGGTKDVVQPPKAVSGKSEAAGKEKKASVPVNQVKAVTADGFVIPDVDATVTAEAGIVQFNGALVRDLALKATLKNGRATVDDLSAILPGSTSFGVTGTVGAKDGKPDMDLALSSRSDNLREMLEWVGLDTATVPADRLRRFSMSASITGAPRNVVVRDINIQLDASKLSGGLALVMRDRPAFGLRLVVDRVNVDGYILGGRDAPIGGVPTGAGASPGGKDSDDAKGTAMGGLADALAFLETFDANIDATVRNFIVARTPASDLHVDMTVLNGGLEVRKAEIGDLAGLRGSLKGTLDRSSEKPTLVAEYSAEIMDVARFSRFVDNPSLMEYRGHGRFASSGKVDGNIDHLAVNSRLQALGMTVSVNGVLTSLLQSPAFKLATSVRAPELVQMVRLVEDNYSPAAGKLGPVDLTFQLEGSQTQVKADSITGHAGPVTLHGSASLAMTDPRPKLQARIATSEVSLDLFLPPESRRRSAAPAVHRIIPVAARATSAPIGSRWSSDPIDTAQLAAFDADVDLEMAVLAKDPYRFKDAKLQFRLEEGKLSLDRFFANFSTGTVVATGTAEPAKDGLIAAMNFEANGVDVSDVAEALKNYQVRLGPVRFGAKMSGPITLTSDLKTQGANEYQLVSALNGSARLTGQLRTETSSETRQASAVAGLAGALLGKKVKEIRGVTDVVQGTDLLVSAFDGPSTLNGDIAVENGVFTTKNLVLVGRGGRALTTGTANLPAWRLDSVTDVTLGQDEDPYVTAQVTGALDDPYLRKVSGTLLRGRPVSTPPPPPSGKSGSDTTGGQSGPRIVSPQEAEQPTPAAENIKPEDVIKGLLQGLSR